MAVFMGRRTIKADGPDAASLAARFLPLYGQNPALDQGEGAQPAYWAFKPGRVSAKHTYYAGDEVTAPTVVPYGAGGGEGQTPWDQSLDALGADVLKTGTLTPDQLVGYMNTGGMMHEPRAALNQDGTISYDEYSFDDEFDFGNVILAAGAAWIGYMSGGFGMNELMSSFGGSSSSGFGFGTPESLIGAEGAAEGAMAGGGAAETLGAGPSAATGAETASTTENLSRGIIDADSIIDPTGSGASGAQTRVAEQMFTEGARAGASNAPGAPKGLIERLIKWGDTHPRLAASLLQVGAGAIGGAGKAALAKEQQELAIQANKNLLTQRHDEQLRMSRAGTYIGAPLSTPSGQQVLRRPDGSLVYGPGGLIVGAMGR